MNELHQSEARWTRISSPKSGATSDLLQQPRDIRSPIAAAEKPYLTDERWALICSHVPGKEGDPGCRGRDNRLFIEAVLWIARTGQPWRALPPCYGKWYTTYTRFRRWSLKNTWQGLFTRLAEGGARDYFFENGIVRYLAAAREAGPRQASLVRNEDRAA